MDEVIPEIIKSLESIADQIRREEEKYLQKIQETKGNFNIFTLLLPAHDETRLHSKFIAHLLNPNGSHGFGKRFFNLFIDTLCEGDNVLCINGDATLNLKENLRSLQKINSFSCVTEKKTDGGRRIDIYLEGKSFKIAIENKIWAIEQDNQIQDYANSMKSDCESKFLFFLTLYGRESKTAGNAKYIPISYKNHILTEVYNFHEFLSKFEGGKIFFGICRAEKLHFYEDWCILI